MAIEKIKSFQIDTNEIAEKSLVDALEPHARAYDVSGGISGVPTADLIVTTFLAARTFSFPVDLVGSIGKAGTPSTGTAVFSIQKNGLQFATLTFDNSGNGVLSGTEESFVPGDTLTVVAPAIPDATLSNIYFTLMGTLTTI